MILKNNSPKQLIQPTNKIAGGTPANLARRVFLQRGFTAAAAMLGLGLAGCIQKNPLAPDFGKGATTIYNLKRPAILTIKDKDGIILTKASVFPGGKFDYKEPNGTGVFVEVRDTRFDYSLNEKSALLSVVSQTSPHTVVIPITVGGNPRTNVGESISAGNFTVTLSDIGLEQTTNILSFAMVSLKDSSGNTLVRAQMPPGEDGSCYLENAEAKYRIEVAQTGAGALLSETFAEIKAFVNGSLAAKGIVDVGSAIQAGELTVVLDDLTLPQSISPENGKLLQSRATFAIYDASAGGQQLAEPELMPRETSIVYLGSAMDQESIKIKLLETAPGYTLHARWARVEISAREGAPQFAGWLDLNQESNGIKLANGRSAIVKLSGISNPEWM